MTGALGSSVAHDSHNLIVAGTNARDMLVCARALAEHGGGFVVASGGTVRAMLPLPVAGLLSLEDADTVCRQLDEVNHAAAGAGLPARGPVRHALVPGPAGDPANCGSRPRACSTSANSASSPCDTITLAYCQETTRRSRTWRHRRSGLDADDARIGAARRLGLRQSPTSPPRRSISGAGA